MTEYEYTRVVHNEWFPDTIEIVHVIDGYEILGGLVIE